MNKRGFTLIELLAVIVILAIIAVIAVPIVLNIIDESKSNAGLRSADFYLDAVEMSVVQATLKEKNIQDGTYNILENGNICLETYDSANKTCVDSTDEGTDVNILEVEVNGETPTSGKISITNGNISSIELNYKDGKTIIKNSDGDLVYQDESGAVKLCTANTIQATALVYQNVDPLLTSSYVEEEVGLLASTDGDAFAKGVAYTCNFIDGSEANNMTFFVLSSTEETVTLIAGFNLKATSGNTHTVVWSSDGNNHEDETEDKQAVTAKAALTERTSNWSSANGGKLSEEQMLTIKLPTAYQIAEALGQTFSGSSISGLPTWLTSYTKAPVAYGYWTSTPYAGSSDFAWFVSSSGSVGNTDVIEDSLDIGVRPVITISKSNV